MFELYENYFNVFYKKLLREKYIARDAASLYVLKIKSRERKRNKKFPKLKTSS